MSAVPEYQGSTPLEGDLEQVVTDLVEQVHAEVPENELIIGYQVEIGPVGTDTEISVTIITDNGT
jgi:hypothetical protein